MHIVALIQEQEGAYRASFPDFPDCTATANDPDAVIAKAGEVLSHQIARIIAEDRELPQVRSLSRLAKDPAFLADSTGLMVALVPYTPGTREVRLEITLDESLIARIDRAADTVGETRSGYLANAARHRLVGDANADSAVAIPLLHSTTHSIEALETERTVSEHDSFADTTASLVCIKEILERLDSSFVKQDDSQLIPKPGAVKPNQRLLLKPAR
jgi:predicted RNase H-like HicB family nuclease